MLFGTSYRSWWDQIGEYCREFGKSKPYIEVSSEPWIAFGGLKWCSVYDFQDELDKEGDGRRVSDFTFRRANRVELNCLRVALG